ncbi:MAG: hypothetical protein J2P22_15135 [Nocardioides sp.]|nr:hypothetical protein [Nocardioides sp.]
MNQITFTTGAAVVAIDTRSHRFRDAVLRAAGSPGVLGLPAEPDVVLAEVEADATGFGPGLPVTRGATRHPDGGVELSSAGGSGYRQRWLVDGDRLRVESCWDPSAKENVAARALPTRFRSLRGEVLLHYPVLWWASLRGMAPLHVSVLEVNGTVFALAGPGGVGKSSLVSRELASRARVTCDNLAVSDGRITYGLREPLRIPEDAGTTVQTGPRAAHGRREVHGGRTVPRLEPAAIVVVRRDAGVGRLRPVDPDEAHRALVAGTMTAGELMRFWPMAATLALATGRGPVMAPVDEVARRLVDRLPCYELQLGHSPRPPLRDLLAPVTSTRAEVSG